MPKRKISSAFLQGEKTFTAVKRKKLRQIRSFRALKFESVQTSTSAKFVWKRCINCPDKANFAPIKLTSSETALCFAVKVKLSTFVFIFLSKIMTGTAHASCVWPLCWENRPLQNLKKLAKRFQGLIHFYPGHTRRTPQKWDSIDNCMLAEICRVKKIILPISWSTLVYQLFGGFQQEFKRKFP